MARDETTSAFQIIELPEAATSAFQILELPEAAMRKFLVKLSRHNTCPVKQDVIDAATEVDALRLFAQRHKADMSEAKVTLAGPQDRIRQVVGGK